MEEEMLQPFSGFESPPLLTVIGKIQVFVDTGTDDVEFRVQQVDSAEDLVKAGHGEKLVRLVLPHGLLCTHDLL